MSMLACNYGDNEEPLKVVEQDAYDIWLQAEWGEPGCGEAVKTLSGTVCVTSLKSDFGLRDSPCGMRGCQHPTPMT